MRSTLSVVIGILTGAATLSAQSRGPERPVEPFTVYVFSNLEDEDDDKKYTVEKLTKEVQKRIKKHKHWFQVTDSPEKAEATIEVVRHTLDENMRHKLESRVNVQGNGKDWVTTTWMQERHYLEVRVDTFGTQRLVQAEDTRENGGSLKRAAENLADELESYFRENYEELSAHR